MNKELLFIYGSLLDTSNEFGQYIHSNAKLIGNSVFKGRLFDCGDYPGAIIDEDGYEIKGSIYRLNHPHEAFSLLDYYEGFGDEEEQPNLFIRTIITARCGDTYVDCWIYLYNLPVKGFIEITSGDYRAYIKS